MCAYVGSRERESGLHRLRVVVLGGRYAELMFKMGVWEDLALGWSLVVTLPLLCRKMGVH